jgi:hypothetical protein
LWLGRGVRERRLRWWSGEGCLLFCVFGVRGVGSI